VRGVPGGRHMLPQLLPSPLLPQRHQISSNACSSHLTAPSAVLTAASAVLPILPPLTCPLQTTLPPSSCRWSKTQSRWSVLPGIKPSCSAAAPLWRCSMCGSARCTPLTFQTAARTSARVGGAGYGGRAGEAAASAPPCASCLLFRHAAGAAQHQVPLVCHTSA
jgi:hypothetical protein